jgi:D-arabinose 1-dehydrogenase-like Zn-dependent alcohol dehydrogenase
MAPNQEKSMTFGTDPTRCLIIAVEKNDVAEFLQALLRKGQVILCGLEEAPIIHLKKPILLRGI